VRCALRPAQVGADHHPRAGGAQLRQGRQHRPDPAVVGDATVLQGHAEVGTHQHPAAADPRRQQVVQTPDAHSEAPTSLTRSTRRLEKPHSLSYQPTTLTWSPMTLVRPASKMHDAGSVTMSAETIGSST